MVINTPIKRIIRSLSSARVLITDLNIRLDPGEEIDVLKVESFNNKYYRTLSQLGNSQDLDQAVSLGLVEIEDENGNILTSAQSKRASYEATLWDVDNASGGGSGTALAKDVSQVAHGFGVGDAIYFDGSSWLKAQADNEDTLGIGLVSDVDDNDNFTVTFTGIVSGLSGLIAGDYYFVSTDTAGALTPTKPTSGYENPILFATGTTEGIVFAYRPSSISATGGGGSITVPESFTDLDDVPSSYSGYSGYLVKVKEDGTGLEFVGDDSMLAQRIDFITDDEFYTGTAPAGSSTASAVWRIKKTTIDSGGEGDVTVTWADGNTNFDNVWDNRLSLTYS